MQSKVTSVGRGKTYSFSNNSGFQRRKKIREVIKEIRESTSFQTQIIVVDGGSNDGTEEITKEENIEMIAVPRPGHGRAIRTGLDHGIGDIVEIIDADGTYEARDMNRLVSPISKDRVDVCLASRIGGTILPSAMQGTNYVGYSSNSLIQMKKRFKTSHEDHLCARSKK